ncbi:hypothetical protein PV341_15345 [Streptomyces sp. PA03-1a]|nr:hypothetical protein [Streptomyces sp. PA03-1a]MDX2814620.1 hypothetical protein [Streptomyces sp. PA03-5A]
MARRSPGTVSFDGIDLIGKMSLVVRCSGDLGPNGLNMYVRSARAGDVMVSEARLCAAGWEDHG